MRRRVTYSTAVANVSVPMGEIRPLSSNQVSATHTVDYCGNVIYEGGNLSKILTEEGYITLSGSTPTYHYYLKDHQGNNRVVTYWNDSKWLVEQVNHYYHILAMEILVLLIEHNLLDKTYILEIKISKLILIYNFIY